MQIGPRYKKARYLGAPVFRKTQTQKFSLRSQKKTKIGGRRRGGKSEYGRQMLEKQKARYSVYELTVFAVIAVLFLFLGSRDPSPLALGLIVAATACRVLLVLGLVATRSLARPNPMRFTGALGTYLAGAALSVLLLARL